MADTGWRRNKYGGWFNINDIKDKKTTNEYMNAFIKQKGGQKTKEYKYLPEDDTEAYDKYYEMSDESYYKLTEQERQIIKNKYVGKEESYDINETLRKNENIDEDLLKAMDKACTTYEAKEDMAGTRSIDMDYLRNEYGLDIKKYGDVDRKEVADRMKKFIGKETTMKGYTSISLNESGNGMFGNLAVKMEIDMPTGTKMYVADNLGEYEAILGRNKKMILTDVSFKPSKITGFESEYGKILLKYEILKDD